jgi:hypothetical protein
MDITAPTGEMDSIKDFTGFELLVVFTKSVQRKDWWRRAEHLGTDCSIRVFQFFGEIAGFFFKLQRLWSGSTGLR